MTALIPPALTVHPNAAYSEPTPLPLVRIAAMTKPAAALPEAAEPRLERAPARTDSGGNRPRLRQWLHQLVQH